MVTAVERSVVADAAGGMHGFPAALTSFVGRARVVDEIVGQLGQYRLVTVTGLGVPGRRGWPTRWPGGWSASSLRGCGWRWCEIRRNIGMKRRSPQTKRPTPPGQAQLHPPHAAELAICD